uniref:Uncharacterized protein n=1 Tax=Anguilla anguilla TaxID=7936 RepID=A0A0E9X4T2_ANGAN
MFFIYMHVYLYQAPFETLLRNTKKCVKTGLFWAVSLLNSTRHLGLQSCFNVLLVCECCLVTHRGC